MVHHDGLAGGEHGLDLHRFGAASVETAERATNG